MFLQARSLLSARRHRDTLLARVFLRLAGGCAVYLSTAVMRGTLDVNDPVAYLSGIAAFLLLMLPDHPRLLPALSFKADLQAGRIPRGAVGAHEAEFLPDRLAFRSGHVDHAMRYSNVAGLTAYKEGLLFLLGDGAAEFVPASALKQGGDASAPEALRARVVEGRDAPAALQPMPPYEGEGALASEYTFTLEEYLRVNALHERRTRQARLLQPAQLILAAVLLWTGAGSLYGVISLARGTATPYGFMPALCYAGVAAAVLGLVMLYRPVRLVNWVMRKKLAPGMAPEGFFGPHTLQAHPDWAARSSGVSAMKVAWPYFTHAVTDGKFLLLYQHLTLVLFVPLERVGAQAAALLMGGARRHLPVSQA
ncbi:MAG TPA: hypothetical protein VLA21_05455 [Candidatus Limnocylindria bacterium]|nr:hypothetical protein [Candidatus Limnocylindria bacterium]